MHTMPVCLITRAARVSTREPVARPRYSAARGLGGGGIGQFTVRYGVAVVPAGNVFVAGSGKNGSQEFGGSGEFQAAWGSGGGGNGQFNVPYGVAVDPAGNVYVADSGNNR